MASGRVVEHRFGRGRSRPRYTPPFSRNQSGVLVEVSILKPFEEKVMSDTHAKPEPKAQKGEGFGARRNYNAIGRSSRLPNITYRWLQNMNVKLASREGIAKLSRGTKIVKSGGPDFFPTCKEGLIFHAGEALPVVAQLEESRSVEAVRLPFSYCCRIAKYAPRRGRKVSMFSAQTGTPDDREPREHFLCGNAWQAGGSSRKPFETGPAPQRATGTA